jgi:hypothetical protein
MTKNKDKSRELARLTDQLSRVRQHSLAASRNNDFRAVARLTSEAARLNHLILAATGAPAPALAELRNTLFEVGESPASATASSSALVPS